MIVIQNQRMDHVQKMRVKSVESLMILEITVTVIFSRFFYLEYFCKCFRFLFDFYIKQDLFLLREACTV